MNYKDIDSIYEKFKSEKVGTKSLLPYVKKILLSEKDATKDLSFTDECRVFDYIVKEILKINEETFYNLYSAEFLARYKLKNLAYDIVNHAPEDIRKKYYFIRKDILMGAVWHEYYNERYTPFTYEELFNCQGDLKQAFTRGAEPKLESVHASQDVIDNDGNPILNKNGETKKRKASKAKSVEGEIIDSMVFDIIDTYLRRDMGYSVPDTLYFLGNIYNLYGEKKLSLPGIISVIEKRKIYRNPIEFYFQHLPVKLQENYFDDFLIYDPKPSEAVKMITEAYYGEPYEDVMKDLTGDYDYESVVESLKKKKEETDIER